MKNTWAGIRRRKVVSGPAKDVMIDFRHDAAAPGLGGERGSSSSHALERCEDKVSLEQATSSSKVGIDVEYRIESSKVHWSELLEYEPDFDDEEVAQENMKVFEELQLHPNWGQFFKTFGYDTKVWRRVGELELVEKFAEGAQAELFHAKVIWMNSKKNERDLEKGREWVLKVFKKGTRLRELQAQWPLGFLQSWSEIRDRIKHGLPPIVRYHCDVHLGTLLEDGRFAFLMKKEHDDLRSHIFRAMFDIGNDHGPFSKDEVERIMFHVAQGMNWLHNNNILHRDLKASNVLISDKVGFLPNYYVADFECSIGVVGTGFFIAPEIMQVLKNRGGPRKVDEVFSKAADVYSYGMMCYEVLTGKLPFEGHPRNDYDLVLRRQRPRIPEYVDSWMKKLLHRCWDVDCSKRPMFLEILEILSSNSASVREAQSLYLKYEEEKYRKYEDRFLLQSLIVESK